MPFFSQLYGKQDSTVHQLRGRGETQGFENRTCKNTWPGETDWVLLIRRVGSLWTVLPVFAVRAGGLWPAGLLDLWVCTQVAVRLWHTQYLKKNLFAVLKDSSLVCHPDSVAGILNSVWMRGKIKNLYSALLDIYFRWSNHWVWKCHTGSHCDMVSSVATAAEKWAEMAVTKVTHSVGRVFFFFLSRPFVYLELCSSGLSFCFSCSWLRQCGPLLLWLTHSSLARLSDTLSLSSSFCLCWGGSSEGGTWGSICTCFACTPGQRVSHRICVTVLVCAFKMVAAGTASPLSN